MYVPVIAQLQSQLAALNAKATTGYADYTADAETGIGAIQALDFPLAPPKDNNDGDDKKGDKKGDEDKKHGGSKSVGKGAKTHIEVHGDQERQWGTPTDPHEVAVGPAASTAIGAAGNGTARDTKERPMRANTLTGSPARRRRAPGSARPGPPGRAMCSATR